MQYDIRVGQWCSVAQRVSESYLVSVVYQYLRSWIDFYLLRVLLLLVVLLELLLLLLLLLPCTIPIRACQAT